MNAKRKTLKVKQETGDDPLTDDENAQLAAEGEGLATRDAGDEARPNMLADDAAPFSNTARPGQAPNRDDEVDATFRASQGMGAGAASGTWKPAEPTPVMDGPDIPEIPLAAAKPGYETIESGRIPGAGDPQNGEVLTDWTQSPIAWVNPRWPTHQPNSGPPPTQNIANARERMGGLPGMGEPGAPGAPGKDIGQQEFPATDQPPPIVPHPDDPDPTDPQRPAEQGTEAPPAGDYQNNIYPPGQPEQPEQN